MNPSDAVAFRRIVNVPRRSIGQQTLASLVEAANAEGISVGQAVFDRELLKRAVPKKQKELDRFAELIEALRAKREGLSISELLVSVMEDSGYLRELKSEDTSDARTRIGESSGAYRRCQRIMKRRIPKAASTTSSRILLS